MSRLRRYEPFLDWDGHEVESEQASMREHENGAWTDYFMALSIEAERDALKARVAELLESDHKVIEALTAKVASLSSHETCACSVDTPEDVCMHHSPEVMRLRARVAELEAARQWQPIESCPLDTQVLLLVNGTLPDIGYRRSYGWSLRGCFEFTGTEGYYPTHWQPLPEIPD